MAKNTPPAPKQKHYYDVKIDSLLQATLMWRILAETPEEAFLLSKNLQPTSVKYKLNGRRDIKATVYDAYTTMIRFLKNLGGR